jgi:tRNA A58 N-methylase Trm61
VQSHRGIIKHEDLIGRRVRDVVTTSYSSRTAIPERLGTEYRLHEVKLEEYVRLSRRLVTPVYPADARLIVELLDLHPNPSNESNGYQDERLEILEAGTGHGALTLYLSRAIHGANPPLPAASSLDANESVDDWRRNRRAVIHTLDISEKYSLHARNVVKGFRHGLYYQNVDFHVTDVASWLRKELASRSSNPLLSHAILDLPNSNTHLADIAQALRVDGTLVVFNPSITQITQCATEIREKKLPLELERVVELPTNGEAGGREWDVRPVRPRATLKVEASRNNDEGPEGLENEAEGKGLTDSSVEDLLDSVEESGEERVDAPRNKESEGWQMVCRPKVGDRIIGGGFVGVWKKQRNSTP